MKVTGIIALIAVGLTAWSVFALNALGEPEVQEKVVYSVFRRLDMGQEPAKPPKDYYVSIGEKHGVSNGATLDVFRKTPTYDFQSRKLHKEVIFKIAKLKVVHVEREVAIARLVEMFPENETPVIDPRNVMVGDQVEIAQ